MVHKFIGGDGKYTDESEIEIGEIDSMLVTESIGTVVLRLFLWQFVARTHDGQYT